MQAFPHKEDRADRSVDCMKALNNIKSFLGNDEQKVVADGYSDLSIDRSSAPGTGHEC